MAMKKDITEKVNTLVSYIKENTADQKWLVLTYREIAQIVGTTPGSSTTKRIVETIKSHDNIAHTLLLDPSKGKKPLQFRYVTKEEKVRFIDHQQFKYLTDEDIDVIQNAIGYYSYQELHELLAVLNYIKSIYVPKKFSLPEVSFMSNLLGIPEESISFIIETLYTKELIVDDNGITRLNLTYTEVAEEQSSSNLQLRYEELEKAQESFMIYVQENYLDRINKLDELEEKLASGHQMTQKLIDAYQEERTKSNDLSIELARKEQQLDQAIAFKEDLSYMIQEQLEVFLWQVQQIALEDSKTSLTTKNSNAYRAKLSKRFVETGQQFYEQIMGFSKV